MVALPLRGSKDVQFAHNERCVNATQRPSLTKGLHRLWTCAQITSADVYIFRYHWGMS